MVEANDPEVQQAHLIEEEEKRDGSADSNRAVHQSESQSQQHQQQKRVIKLEHFCRQLGVEIGNNFGRVGLMQRRANGNGQAHQFMLPKI